MADAQNPISLGDSAPIAPGTVVDETPISPLTSPHNRDALSKHLSTRPAEADLKDRGILRDTNAAPAIQAAQAELARQQAADAVKRGLAKRPERGELVDRNILPDSNAAPALQEKQKELQKHMRADSLEKALQSRPAAEDLVRDGILPKVDDEAVLEDV